MASYYATSSEWGIIVRVVGGGRACLAENDQFLTVWGFADFESRVSIPCCHWKSAPDEAAYRCPQEALHVGKPNRMSERPDVQIRDPARLPIFSAPVLTSKLFPGLRKCIQLQTLRAVQVRSIYESSK